MNAKIVKLFRAGVVFVCAFAVTGCVSQKKYDELKFAERNCNAERQRLAEELANAKDQNSSLQNEISKLRADLSDKERTISALQQQISGAKEALSKMTSVYEKLAAARIPSPQIQINLPPELDKALKDFAARHPEMVTYDSNRGLVKFVSDVLFDLGSDKVKPEAKKSLAELAKILTGPTVKNFDVVVVGHTDNIPIAKPSTRAKHPTNWHLSVHRAISVMRVLEDNGVSPKILGVMGYGEYRPIASNETAEGRAKNRRVEVYILPKKISATPAATSKKKIVIEK